jgi:hypothetical protein
MEGQIRIPNTNKKMRGAYKLLSIKEGTSKDTKRNQASKGTHTLQKVGQVSI